MLKTIIYARYSSDKQNEQSIEGQIHECEQFAKTHDMVIIKHYIDRALSGKTDDRPSFLQMIKDSSSGLFDAVLVYKTDRFARNRYDSAVYKAKLKKNGIKIFYAKENIPDGPEGIILECCPHSTATCPGQSPWHGSGQPPVPDFPGEAPEPGCPCGHSPHKSPRTGPGCRRPPEAPQSSGRSDSGCCQYRREGRLPPCKPAR